MRTPLRLAHRTVLSVALAVAAAAPAGAQLLHDNGPLVTHAGAGAGGADASALTTPNTVYGFGHAVAAGVSVADDFTVGPAGWDVASFRFFGYQTGSSTTSSFTGLFLQLWNARPDAPGAAVVWGDHATNRLTGSGFTGVYRTLASNLGNADRPIMYLDVAVGSLPLGAGTYWAHWTTTGSLGSGPWAPPVSYAGSTAPTGDAMQLIGEGWQNVVDSGTGSAQGLPFQVHGSAVSTVPEPGTYALLATGLVAVAGVARRRRAR